MVRASGGQGSTNNPNAGANTGDGGSGGAKSLANGRNGGSGVVIIRYKFQ